MGVQHVIIYKEVVQLVIYMQIRVLYKKFKYKEVIRYINIKLEILQIIVPL